MRSDYFNIEKGEKIASGKTKNVYEAVPGKLILKNTGAITAHDDPTLTKIYPWKGPVSTTVTAHNFRLLREAGISVAFEGLNASDELLVPACKPIRLELIARRVADLKGSYVKRHPYLLERGGGKAVEFDPLVIEVFLKTTDGHMIGWGERHLGALPQDVLESHKVVDDPFCEVRNETVHLWHSKLPRWDPRADLKIDLRLCDLLPCTLDSLLELTYATFLVLEKGWQMRRCRLKDFKIEAGFVPGDDRQPRVIDVIDLDSARIEDPDGREMSKQIFRDGGTEAEVRMAYEKGAAFAEQLYQPKPALVIWAGSSKDPPPDVPTIHGHGLHVEEFPLSAHKEPDEKLQQKLEKLHRMYRKDGIVFIAEVGRLNGLAPYLYRRSPYPVITFSPEKDVAAWSVDSLASLRTPSGIAPMVVGSAMNAVEAALRILSANNPAVYAHTEFQRWKLKTS